MEIETLFAQVLIPLPLAGTFTYRVPFELAGDATPGKRVVVQFGRKKIYTGLITELTTILPKGFIPKYILSVIDDEPVISTLQLKLWQWIAKYYICTEGEVMNAALPAALKLASETKVVLHPDFNGNYDNLTEKQFLLTEALEIHKILTISEAAKVVDQLKIIPLINTLIEKGVVELEETLENRYKPREETFVSLSPEYHKQELMIETMNTLERKAQKQLDVLMRFIMLSQRQEEPLQPIKKSKIVSKVKGGDAAITALIKKGVLVSERQQVSRLTSTAADNKAEDIVLSVEQNTALEDIKRGFIDHPVTLLHGVTGSGKTELYIKLISEVLQKGKQALYLLPEIALTAQITHRLQHYFGHKVGIYHSKYNDQERVEIWQQVLKNNQNPNDGYQIILGARSALLLPYQNLGLIIVDEEHDASYKQYDPAPRYNARDTAIVLAAMHQAKTLLGTATPSIESYFNVRQGKYHLTELTKRYGGARLPEILVVDVQRETARKQMKSHFSVFLLRHIQEALENQEQIILFQNRRGFSLRLECDTCHNMPQCKNCDVTLIYHKQQNILKCHYCGYSTTIPTHCPECGSPDIKMKGFGTEKIEDELQIFFPQAQIKRMDLDTTRGKKSHQHIINDFEDHKIDILVGTQMVTKGLDFGNVTLVGILNADNMLSFPDFRAFERSFQMLAQVSGRSGRKQKQGKVIIQTRNPYHAAIRSVIDNDFMAMYNSQILERRNFKYPPFIRLIRLTVKHHDNKKLNEGSLLLARMLKQNFGERILGPEFPVVARVRNEYLKIILIKLERNNNLSKAKRDLKDILDTFSGTPDGKGIKIILDVDPV